MKQALYRMLRVKVWPGLQRVKLTEWFGRIVRPWGIRIIRPPLKFFCFCFLTWIHFGLCFFLLPSAFLSFFACLELIFEQVCIKSKASSLNGQATNFEPPFIVRSRTRNYKIYTKSSVLHLLVTLESRKVLNLVNLSPWLWMLKLRGLLSFATLMVKW